MGMPMPALLPEILEVFVRESPWQLGAGVVTWQGTAPTPGLLAHGFLMLEGILSEPVR
jgi:hypothetical protein